MGHSANISLGIQGGKAKKAKRVTKAKNQENIILRLSASLARSLEGEFNLY